MNVRLRIGELPKEGEDQQNGMFRHRIRIATRRRYAGNRNASPPSRFQIYTFQAGTPLLDQPDLQRVHDVCIDPEHHRDHNVYTLKIHRPAAVGPYAKLVLSLEWQTLLQQ
jgi:hypothetical protein